MVVTVRKATEDDVIPLSILSAEGYRFSAYQAAVFPENRRIKPDIQDRIDWLVKTTLPRIRDSTNHYIVAVEEDVIVGTAQWISPPDENQVSAVEGSKPAQKKRDASLPPYIDPEAATRGGEEIQVLLAQCENDFNGKDRNRMWTLNSICVDPNHRRKGIAKKLTQWGLERAKKQSQDVWLIAAEEGMPVYRSLGFKTLGVGSRFGENQYVMLLP